MLRVKYINHRRPICFQMLIAGALGIMSISLCTCLWLLLSLGLDGRLDINNLTDLLSSFLFGILIILVPINLSSLLFIHLIGLFKNIMYSVKMVILESCLLIMSNIIIHIILRENNVEGFYVKSVLLLSIVVELYFAFFMRKIFQRRYLIFQKQLEHSHIQPNINQRVDIIITIVSNIVILIPSLFFVFVLF